MRVIAGSARSMPLKTVPGLSTRPTTDRIKETLFNILQNQIPGCQFLDLFSGSGAIGIEALSRGAKEAVFVEKAKNALGCIRENLQFTKLMDRALVMEGDCAAAVERLGNQGRKFDCIFMDPPYKTDAERDVLAAIKRCGIADENTLIIIEAALHSDFTWAEEMGFSIDRVKEYKTNEHIFMHLERE